MVQAFILIGAFSYVIVNLIVDILVGIIDPRTRGGSAVTKMSGTESTDRQGAANAAAGVTERPGIVLGVNGLETEFRSRGGIVRAVRDVSLELERTQKVGIVGESGSGKSAFALSVLGLLEPPGYVVGGEVMLNGRDISGLDDRAMQSVRGREISIVFQDPMSALNPVKSIGQQIVETIRMHQPNIGKKGARAAAIELLRDVEVPGAARASTTIRISTPVACVSAS